MYSISSNYLNCFSKVFNSIILSYQYIKRIPKTIIFLFLSSDRHIERMHIGIWQSRVALDLDGGQTGLPSRSSNRHGGASRIFDNPWPVPVCVLLCVDWLLNTTYYILLYLFIYYYWTTWCNGTLAGTIILNFFKILTFWIQNINCYTNPCSFPKTELLSTSIRQLLTTYTRWEWRTWSGGLGVSSKRVMKE